MFLVGISLAGLADVIDIRFLVVVSSLVLIGGGCSGRVMPGIGRPAAEWRRAMAALPAGGDRRPARSQSGRRPWPTSTGWPGICPPWPGSTRSSVGPAWPPLRSATCRPARRSSASGEVGDAAYFILDGRAAAGTPEPDGGYRSLSTMTAGDFFGEIAALTGSRRTATVVGEEPTTVVEVPAAALRALMSVPELGLTVPVEAHRAAQPDEQRRPAAVLGCRSGVPQGPPDAAAERRGAAEGPEGRRPVWSTDPADRPRTMCRS